jgi:hypothetical protein
MVSPWSRSRWRSSARGFWSARWTSSLPPTPSSSHPTPRGKTSSLNPAPPPPHPSRFPQPGNPSADGRSPNCVYSWSSRAAVGAARGFALGPRWEQSTGRSRICHWSRGAEGRARRRRHRRRRLHWRCLVTYVRFILILTNTTFGSPTN